MIRAVFDTVVFVRSLINPFGPWGRLVFTYADRYQLLVSAPTVREALQVLSRPELVQKYHTLATRNPHAVLDLFAQAEHVELQGIPSVSRDPKDDPFLATAVQGRADYLVSEDRDLLDLGAYKGIPLVTAAAFLRILEETTE